MFFILCHRFMLNVWNIKYIFKTHSHTNEDYLWCMYVLINYTSGQIDQFRFKFETNKPFITLFLILMKIAIYLQVTLIFSTTPTYICEHRFQVSVISARLAFTLLDTYSVHSSRFSRSSSISQASGGRFEARKTNEKY